jgi:hypothetical protein
MQGFFNGFLVLLSISVLFCGCTQQGGESTTTTTTTTLPCNDTDGGKDYLTKGTASGYNESMVLIEKTDYCLNTDQLIEAFCDREGYLRAEVVSCRGVERTCLNGVCSAATTTTTTTSTTTTTTTTTIPGECVTGGCGDVSIAYDCAWSFDELGNNFTYVRRLTVIPYCADAGTTNAKCKSREKPSIEDRCENYEICIEGMTECQPVQGT